jgi:hypothetical protein
MVEEDLKSAADTLKDLPSDRAYKPAAPKRYRSKKPLLFLAVIILLAAGGFAVKKFVLDKRTTQPVQTAPSTTPEPEEQSVSSDVPETSAIEDFKSTGLGLSFKHPKTWKVSELEGGIRIESPDFNYQAIDSGEVSGNFRIYIRKGARDVDGTFIGRGVAIRPSEKLTYTQPAAGQRTETLLSSFGYNSADIFSFFLIAGNFQLAKGDTLGPNYGKEPDTYIVVGGYSSKGLTEDLSMNSMDPESYMNTNAYKQAYAIIQSLQLK